MKTKYILIIILSIFISGCIDSSTQQISHTPKIKVVENIISDKFEISYMIIDETHLQINVANVGRESVSAVVVDVPHQGIFRIIGDDEFVIGNLNSGDYTPITINLVKNYEGKINNFLYLYLTYTDKDGNRQAEDIQLNIK